MNKPNLLLKKLKRQFLSITKRELISYFATPVAYVFITIFLLLSGLFTFYLGNFFEIGQASLGSFFEWHPWLYLFLIPAITMRLWSEEKKSGTIELLTTLPVSTLNIVLGKFMAAWLFTLLALILTFPMWITVNYLGNPDNGVIIASYFGSFLMDVKIPYQNMGMKWVNSYPFETRLAPIKSHESQLSIDAKFAQNEYDLTHLVKSF